MAYRTRSLAVALLISASGVLPAMLTGALGERIKDELGAGETALGLTIAAFFLTSGALAAAGGRLVDRIGWPVGVRLGAAGSAASLVAVATVARDPVTLGACLALGGAAMSVTMPTGSLVVAREVPPARQGLLFGIKQTAIPVAGLFAGASVPALALTVGWRWAFGVAVVFPLTAALLAPRRTAEPAPQRAVAKPERYRPAPHLQRPFRVLALGGAFAAVAISAMAAFLVVSAVDAGLAEGTAGMLVAAASALGLSVRVTVGWLADRNASDGFRPAAGMLGLGVLGFALLAVHVPAAVVAGAALAYGAGWGWPGLFYYGAVVHRPDAPAAATGTVQVGLSTGSAIGPLAFGVVAEGVGFPAAWTGAAVLMAGASLLVWHGARRLTAGAAGAAAEGLAPGRSVAVEHDG